jgi:hypothetical protein
VFAAEPLGQTLNTYGKVDRLLHRCFDQSDGAYLPRRCHAHVFALRGVLSGDGFGPLFEGPLLNAVLEGRKRRGEQPIQSAVKFVHGSIASRANSI